VATSRTCTKCNGTMEEGFVLELGHGNTQKGSEWVEGPPDRRWYGLRTKGKRKLPVTTWRCKRCGFLESWAEPG
jgi:hypothetical protein